MLNEVSLKDMLEKNNNQIDERISDSIIDQLSVKMKNFEKLAADFRQFFNYEHLGSVLDGKADLKNVY